MINSTLKKLKMAIGTGIGYLFGITCFSKERGDDLAKRFDDLVAQKAEELLAEREGTK